MNGIEIELTEMLFCRERRVNLQNRFLQKYHCPILSFCMNIPGPIKTNPQIRDAFEQGKREILDVFSKKEIRIFDSIQIDEKTGDELIMAVDCSAAILKEILIKIEETHYLGRLFDMDVIDMDGNKLSRSTYRKCLICSCQAQECARIRRHSVKEMQDKIDEMLSMESLQSIPKAGCELQ